MSSTSSQELAASASGSNEPECEPSRSVRLIPAGAESSPTTGHSSILMKILPSAALSEAKPMSSAVASPARMSAMPTLSGESAPELPANVQDSTGTSLEPFAWYDRDTRSWRTWQRCLVEGWGRFSGTWPRSAMTRSGIAFAPATSAPLTSGTASGLLPTPSAREGKDWSQAKILAGLDRGDGVAKKICARSQVLRSSAEIVGLNPSFAEWMMGYPEGWTDSIASAIPLSRKSRKRSAGQS